MNTFSCFSCCKPKPTQRSESYTNSEETKALVVKSQNQVISQNENEHIVEKSADKREVEKQKTPQHENQQPVQQQIDEFSVISQQENNALQIFANQLIDLLNKYSKLANEHSQEIEPISDQLIKLTSDQELLQEFIKLCEEKIQQATKQANNKQLDKYKKILKALSNFMKERPGYEQYRERINSFLINYSTTAMKPPAGLPKQHPAGENQ